MDLRLVIIFSFSVLYALFEIFMSRLYRGRRNVSISGDKGSLWILFIAIGIGYWLSFTIASMKTGRINNWNTCIILGAILASAGLFIRVKSIITLNDRFTYTVTRLETHHLIETGIYKNIRHPGYLGQLLIFLGISVSLANWLSIMGMTIPILAGFLYRIHTEEKFMSEQMGQQYIEYKKKTKRLIPYIY